MPGRPRTTARLVGELEEQALCMAAQAFLAIPPQYREQPDPADPLNAAWNAVISTTMQASIALEALGDRLRAKAGITEPGPTARFFSDDATANAPAAADATAGRIE